MILRRLTESLRAQHWMTITIDFLVVVIGVFMGVQASNWNQARIERENTLRLLDQLRPELRFQLLQHEKLNGYYATTGAYANVALAGWRGDADVSDRQFVVAAYQASQITGLTYNAANWGDIFGGREIRDIRNDELRTRLIRMLTINQSLTDWHNLETDYRADVRHLIPSDIQDAIRSQCGERGSGGGDTVPSLPPRCDASMPENEVREAAATLRSDRHLPRELAWHRAAVATFLNNNNDFMITLRQLSDAIGAAQ